MGEKEMRKNKMDIVNTCIHYNFIIDEREGMEICTDCGFVISDFHTIENVINTNSIDEKDQYFTYIRNISDKLHVIDGHVLKSYQLFLRHCKKFRAETALHTLALYCLYVTLKNDGSYRPLNCLLMISGESMKNFGKIEKKINKLSKNISIEDVLSPRLLLLNLSENDKRSIIELSKKLNVRSFSPLNFSASLTLLYSKFKRQKISLKKISEIFHVCTMSIHRCSKYLNACNINSFLRKLDDI